MTSLSLSGARGWRPALQTFRRTAGRIGSVWRPAIGAVLTVALAACSPKAATSSASAASASPDTPAAGAKVLRIGYQKSATDLLLLKTRGTLEKRLSAQGVRVSWSEFQFGPPLLEAVNAGSLDVGFVGEAPPIFAQAAGANLVYIGYEPSAPQAEGLLVPKTSTITSVAQLKGKKIAVAKGSNTHYLVVKLLEKNGLKITDIEPIYLAPADARSAFESGKVDAWAIWDPFLATAEKQLGARILADGSGVVGNYLFYLASRHYAETQPDTVRIFLEEVAQVDAWINAHHAEAAQQVAPILGIDASILQASLQRQRFGAQPVVPEVLADQQRVANTFQSLRLIPRQIDVTHSVVTAAPRS